VDSVSECSRPCEELDGPEPAESECCRLARKELPRAAAPLEGPAALVELEGSRLACPPKEEFRELKLEELAELSREDAALCCPLPRWADGVSCSKARMPVLACPAE